MDSKVHEDIRSYCERRDSMLLKDSVDEMLLFCRKEAAFIPSSQEVAEIMLRKAQTAVRTLPLELRLKAHKWLTSRGYESWM